MLFGLLVFGFFDFFFFFFSPFSSLILSKEWVLCWKTCSLDCSVCMALVTRRKPSAVWNSSWIEALNMKIEIRVVQ